MRGSAVSCSHLMGPCKSHVLSYTLPCTLMAARACTPTYHVVLGEADVPVSVLTAQDLLPQLSLETTGTLGDLQYRRSQCSAGSLR